VIPEDDYRPAFVEESLAEQREAADIEREKAKIARREEQTWWRQALSSKVGRRCIWERLQAAGTFRRGNEHFTVAPNGSAFDRATDYHMGAHDYGRQWWEWLLAVETELAILMRCESDPSFAAFRRDRVPDGPEPRRPD
jgi:hypothetical protein